jgi:hypothetical protein
MYSPVQVWDPASGACIRTLGDKRTGSALAAAPDGSWLAAADFEGAAEVWDLANGTLLGALRVAYPLSTALALSETTLAVAGERGPYVLRLARPGS